MKSSTIPTPIYEGWTCLAQFRQGKGVMGTNAIDYWLQKDGVTIRRNEWSQGGDEWRTVDKVPESEIGYKCIYRLVENKKSNDFFDDKFIVVYTRKNGDPTLNINSFNTYDLAKEFLEKSKKSSEIFSLTGVLRFCKVD